MPDLFDLFFRWWKQILLLVIVTLITTTITVFLIPKKYLGETSALPATSYATDKGGVFGQNLQTLYSALGTPDDLDMILGTAHLDTVYKSVASQLDLVPYYAIDKADPAGIQKAAMILKKRVRVIKTDYGELRVKAWDGSRNMAANMANAVMDKLQQMHQEVQTANNAMMLSKINEAYMEKKAGYMALLDSMRHASDPAFVEMINVQKSSLLQQMQEYEKLMNQYKLMVAARPQPLVITELATPPITFDKPKQAQIIVGATILSLIFALLVALGLEKRAMKKSE
jgi:capsular polysaccharide biosynthesis protein